MAANERGGGFEPVLWTVKRVKRLCNQPILFGWKRAFKDMAP
jgi:hypothetical protein